ncbi:hypothetical protein GQ457_07G006850 [Hibiscus cannabinus]
MLSFYFSTVGFYFSSMFSYSCTRFMGNPITALPFIGSSHFPCGSWLFAPFLFNPSGFNWRKNKWMGNLGGIGIHPDKSWESWWQEEQEHLKFTNIRGLLEIILAYGNNTSGIKDSISGSAKIWNLLSAYFHILKGLLVLSFISIMIVLFVKHGLTISDLFASILAFLPTGWAIFLIGQALRPLLKR